MLNYEHLNQSQIQGNLESGIKQVLLNIMPLDYCHCIAAGCAIQWGAHKDNEQMLCIKPIFRCLVMKSDKMNTVIVYEERPKDMGGTRVVAFEYCGPKPMDGSSGGPLMTQPKEAPPTPWGYDFEPPKEWDGT
ncbi:hypothetical protein LCGC14_1469770 [marine sediment metagenome]|uniref:Uncharacterized protein n=1 Tax=marine sediment metagenome TaxID=412755 RepID=A0A0F9JYM0_9ZZZZ